jgi:C4-dicarboxylate-specific signal transduction histidine kinase
MKGLPHIHVRNDNQQMQLFMSVPCLYKNKTAGDLIVWINERTLFSHFVNLDDSHDLNGAGLIDDKHRLHTFNTNEQRDAAAHPVPERIQTLTKNDFSFSSFQTHGESQEMLLACLPIRNLDLSYMAWMPTEQIAGGLVSQRLIWGMGALAAVVLLALGLTVWFSAQNLILKTRFDEAAKQQDKLASKNRQLKAEIQKRETAEKELETQRTLSMHSDRLRSLGEMAAGIAHELNQPLVGVRGFAELMIDSLDQGMELTPEEVRRHAARIVNQVDRMEHVLKSFSPNALIRNHR